jgi:hypothetical protein
MFSEIQHREARYLYFASALAFTATLVEQQLRSGFDVLVESYIFRTPLATPAGH